MNPQCFGESSQILLFKTYDILMYQKWARLFEVPGHIYNLYLIADLQCRLEENIYDLLVICDTHNCTFERLVENEEQAIFQMTGVVNAFLAICFAKPENFPVEYLHDEYFDLFLEFGLLAGKLMRYSF